MQIFFDLDDTLVDKNASLKKCAYRLFQHFEIDRFTTLSAFCSSFVSQNCIIQSKACVFENLAQQFSINPSLKNNLLDTFDNSFHQDAMLFPGVLSSLKLLQELGVTMACVSNGRDFFQRNKINATEIENFFRVIITSGGLGIKKPDPRIFRAALDKTQLKAKDTVFCGDNLVADIRPAKALGMTTIWKQASHSESAESDFILTDYQQFPALWQRLSTSHQ